MIYSALLATLGQAPLLDAMATTAGRSSTTALGAGTVVTAKASSTWDTGLVADVVVGNLDGTGIDGWAVGFDLDADIVNIWNAQVLQHAGTHWVVGNLPANAVIDPHDSTSFGFVTTGRAPVLPTLQTLDGQALVVSPLDQPAAPPVQPVPARGSLLPAGVLSTRGNQIVGPDGTPVRIAAVNWYGLESELYAPQGLWVRSYQSMMDQMAQLGFNAIRLPFSLDLFKPGALPSGIDYSINPDLRGLTGPQVMDKIVAYAGSIGLKIILDDHRSTVGGDTNANGLWVDGGYTEAQWIGTWQALAAHYAGNPAIIAADLSNEPHGPATWGDGAATDWAAAATRAGNAIQAVNPDWLLLVEGVQTHGGQDYWYGGNLRGAQAHPIAFTIPNKLVYSPHDYPASVAYEPWLYAVDYPRNLPALWDATWGYLYQSGTAPVLVGEFGSTLQTLRDQAWLDQLVTYMNRATPGAGDQGISWAYWDWNPTSDDTGGILLDDWTTVDPAKLSAIAPAFYHAAAPVPAPTPVLPAAPGFLFTDPATGTSGSDPGTDYAGPVSYLRHQFIWPGSGGVAVRAGVPNVFLHGGPGADALTVTGGTNVLDGGGGSNFLVGATGADGGTDTFFVDCRAGVETWSTIVNFHPGDSATIFGFHAGLSTRPYTALDGAVGYQGVTIHSEINGPGTGILGSMTFAGISQAVAKARFLVSEGRLPDGTGYLLVQYR